MNRIALGFVVVLIAAGIGLFWCQGPAKVEAAAPPPLAETLAEAANDPEALPLADPGALKGPAPPEATELTKEQRRFFRYDRNRDWRITRSEMLSTRSDAFRKLDKDGNNLLDFEEWAVATVNRFESADVDGNRDLDLAEFAKTAPKPAARKPGCRC